MPNMALLLDIQKQAGEKNALTLRSAAQEYLEQKNLEEDTITKTIKHWYDTDTYNFTLNNNALFNDIIVFINFIQQAEHALLSVDNEIKKTLNDAKKTADDTYMFPNSHTFIAQDEVAYNMFGVHKYKLVLEKLNSVYSTETEKEQKIIALFKKKIESITDTLTKNFAQEFLQQFQEKMRTINKSVEDEINKVESILESTKKEVREEKLKETLSRLKQEEKELSTQTRLHDSLLEEINTLTDKITQKEPSVKEYKRIVKLLISFQVSIIEAKNDKDINDIFSHALSKSIDEAKGQSLRTSDFRRIFSCLIAKDSITSLDARKDKILGQINNQFEILKREYDEIEKTYRQEVQALGTAQFTLNVDLDPTINETRNKVEHIQRKLEDEDKQLTAKFEKKIELQSASAHSPKKSSSPMITGTNYFVMHIQKIMRDLKATSKKIANELQDNLVSEAEKENNNYGKNVQHLKDKLSEMGKIYDRLNALANYAKRISYEYEKTNITEEECTHKMQTYLEKMHGELLSFKALQSQSSFFGGKKPADPNYSAALKEIDDYSHHLKTNNWT